MTPTVFSLEQAASRLRVQPATLRYWIRMFGDMVPKEIGSDCVIDPDQLAIFQQIREAALDDGMSLQQIRLRLQSSRLYPDADTIAALQQLREEVQTLREEVLFLAEESKELQRMLAIVVENIVINHNGQAAAGLNGHGVSQSNAALPKTAITHEAPPKSGAPELLIRKLADSSAAVPGPTSQRWSPPTLGR